MNSKATTITAADAKSLEALLAMHNGSPAAAAHDIHISLTAIRPYTDRRSERLMSILRKLEAQEANQPEAYARNRAFIAATAAR